MKANQAYFYRNRGPWSWWVRIEITSWSGLWSADIPFFSKVCLSLITFVQRFLGPFQMWTHVDFKDSTNIVHHSTKMKKWGLAVYRSEKNFLLGENGSDIRLEGKEFYWPLSFIGIPFAPTMGSVDASTTRASYKMPMAGTQCDCRAFLELPEGRIDIATPWVRGRFSLTDASNKVLKERFERS